MSDYYTCKICDGLVEWTYNPAIDDFAWWCPACETWLDERDVYHVLDLDAADKRYVRARERDWGD